MFKLLLNRWVKLKDKAIEEVDIYQTLLDKIGVTNDLSYINFIPSKSRGTSLTTTTESIQELEEVLIKGALVAASHGYVPEKWKGKYATNGLRILASYIRDGDELIHPFDWVEANRHYIIKLVDSVLKMDDAEREYYQRSINFIIEDILNLLAASKACIR